MAEPFLHTAAFGVGRRCGGRRATVAGQAGQRLAAYLEWWVRQRNAVLAIAGQDQLMDLVAQRHAVAHLGGVNTQFKDLNTLLQIDQINLRCRIIQHQRTAFGGIGQDLGHFFAVGFCRCRYGQ